MTFYVRWSDGDVTPYSANYYAKVPRRQPGWLLPVLAYTRDYWDAMSIVEAAKPPGGSKK